MSDRLYIVRHHSHTYIARKIKDDGDRFAYYDLLYIHKEYKSRSVGTSGRGVWISSRSTNNYSGSRVRKDKNTVLIYNVPANEKPKVYSKGEETFHLILGIAVVGIVILTILSIIYNAVT